MKRRNILVETEEVTLMRARTAEEYNPTSKEMRGASMDLVLLSVNIRGLHHIGFSLLENGPGLVEDFSGLGMSSPCRGAKSFSILTALGLHGVLCVVIGLGHKSVPCHWPGNIAFGRVWNHFGHSQNELVLLLAARCRGLSFHTS